MIHGGRLRFTGGKRGEETVLDPAAGFFHNRFSAERRETRAGEPFSRNCSYKNIGRRGEKEKKYRRTGDSRKDTRVREWSTESGAPGYTSLKRERERGRRETRRLTHAYRISNFYQPSRQPSLLPRFVVFLTRVSRIDLVPSVQRAKRILLRGCCFDPSVLRKREDILLDFSFHGEIAGGQCAPTPSAAPGPEVTRGYNKYTEYRVKE